MTDIAKLALRIDALEVKSAGAELDRLGVKSKKAERDVESFTKKSDSGLKSLALRFGGVAAAGTAMIATVTKSVSAASTFETALVGVSKTTGLAGRDLNDFAGRIDQISRKLPVTTSELLELSQAAGQMGVTGSANLEKFAVTVAKLGRASDLAGEEAATALARILNVTNENIDSIDVLASVIVSLGNNVAATESQIARMTTEVARATSVFDVTSAEAAAMGAAMASIGVQAELGGSSVGRVMQEITSRVQAGGSSLEKFADTLNLNSETLTQLFKDDKVAAFELFLDSVGDLGLDAGNALKSVGLGGQEILKTIVPLSNNMGIFRQTLALANEEVQNATALDREFEATLKTLGTQWQVTKNIVESFARSIGGVLVPALNDGLTALNNFFNAGSDENAIQSQVKLIESIDEKLKSLRSRNAGLNGVIPGASKIFGTNKKELDQLEASLENNIEDLFKMIDAQAKLGAESKKATEVIKKASGATGGLGKESDKASEKVEGLADSIGMVTIGQLKQQESTRRIISLNDEVNRVTASVATEQEKYNQTLAELERLKPYLSVETYSRALKQAEDASRGLTAETRAATTEIDQLWIQANRNIQSSLANSIFNFFDDGLNGMVRGVGVAVGRIASEFAALKLAQGLNLGSLFTTAGGVAAASGGSSALSLAGIGSSLAGGFSGIRSLLTGGGSSAFAAGAGGAGTAFIGGPGTAIGGSGLGAAAGGLSLATGGLVLGGALLTKEFNRLIENDKKIAGVSSNTLNKFINPLSQIPVIGKFLPDLGGVLTGIFGRGELKQKETNLIGDFNSEGFEGVTSVKFKAKGGLVRGSKTDRVINDTDSGELLNGFRELSESGISGALSEVAKEASKAAIELGAFLDDSVQGFSKSLRGSAEALGLGSNAIDNFSSSINIASEKGKSLSEEQIAEELARVADEMATGLIPEIENLSKAGESAFNAVSRLSAETASLSDAANVLGLSLQGSSDLISGLSFEARTSLVDSLGGVEALNQKTQFFANNFLTDAERVDIASQTVNKALTEFGETADSLSKDEFGELLKSFLFLGEEGAESANKLFDVAGSFLIVKDSADQLDQSLREAAESSLERATQISDQIRSEQSTAVNDAFGALSRSIAAEQQDIAEEISVITGHINDLTGVLRSASSAINTINPISKLGARSLIQDAINDSDFNNPKLGNAISALTKSSTDGFATREEFLRDQAESANSLRGLEESAGAQLTLEEQTLSALESESEQLGGILSNAQSQLDALNNIVGLLSVSDAQSNFNNVLAGGAGASSNFGFTQIGSPSRANTPTVSQISDQQIRDFAGRENVSAFDLFNAAREHGISTERATRVLNLDPKNVTKFLKENDLPRLDIGSNSLEKDMPIFAHKGEQIKPKAFVDMEASERREMISLLKKLVTTTEELNDRIRRMSPTGDAMQTREVA